MDSAVLCRTRVEWYPCPRLSSVSVQCRTDPWGITWGVTSTHISYSVNHELCDSVWEQHSLFLSADIRTSVHPFFLPNCFVWLTFFHRLIPQLSLLCPILFSLGVLLVWNQPRLCWPNGKWQQPHSHPSLAKKKPKTYHCTCHPSPDVISLFSAVSSSLSGLHHPSACSQWVYRCLSCSRSQG